MRARALKVASAASPRLSSLRLRSWSRELREIVLVLLVTFAYFLTRGVFRGGDAIAFLHAKQLLAVERALHLSPEAALQRFGLQHPALLEVANVFYLAGHLPVLIAVAVWLYWKHRRAYVVIRDAFLISAAIGLSVYVLFPVAPPRYLPGFVDTLSASGLNLDGSAVGLLYNPYAAMPSLHVGWALLAGIALVWRARAWWLRAAGAALPVVMTLVVLMTGNHFLFDVLAGVLVALSALGLSLFLHTSGLRARLPWLSFFPVQRVSPEAPDALKPDDDAALVHVAVAAPGTPAASEGAEVI
jgi:membrane-associated phospholipid phosphatase